MFRYGPDKSLKRDHQMGLRGMRVMARNGDEVQCMWWDAGERRHAIRFKFSLCSIPSRTVSKLID